MRLSVRIAKALLPRPLRRCLRALVTPSPQLLRAPGVRQVLAMRWRSLSPRHQGRSVGTPIVRAYWAQFLEAHRGFVRGRVLEVGETETIRRYGGSAVLEAHAIDVTSHSPDVRVVTDLSRAHDIAGAQYDCFIVPFTMHVIADAEAALYHAIRLLRPGGTLLVNFSAVDYQFPSGLDMGTGTTLWVHWCFTPLQVENMLRRVGLGAADFEVQTFGNLLTRVAYQLNVSAEELTTRELNHRDIGHPVLICVRAIRPTTWNASQPEYRSAWVPTASPTVYNAVTGFYRPDPRG